MNKSEFLNLFSLFNLYFIQAMPYGFQSRYLPLIMRKQGVSLTDLGFYKLLLLPWIFKVFIAAFIVDQYKTKRFWLLFSMAILIFGCTLGAIWNDFSYLPYIIFLLKLYFRKNVRLMYEKKSEPIFYIVFILNNLSLEI